MLPVCHLQGKVTKNSYESIVASYPLDLVHIDYLCLKLRKVTNYFTGNVQVDATWSQTAKMIAKVLWDNFIVHCRLPEKILSDQVKNFKSELIAYLWRITSTMKLRTSSYHPQTYGHCQKFNFTLINMLGTLSPEHTSNWESSSGILVHAYNCTHNLVMGFGPSHVL